MIVTVPVTEQAINNFVEEANALLTEGHTKWIDYLNSHKFVCNAEIPADPSSETYLEFQLELWKLVSGRNNYNPSIDEKNNNLQSVTGIKDTYPFTTKSSVEISNYFIAVASILKKSNLAPPAEVLDYGVGWGHTARFLANCGFNVTALDIEADFLDLIQKFSHSGSTEIKQVCSSFVDTNFEEKSFDMAIFFESFHHCLEHTKLISQLRNILKPGGKIVFCGESFYDDWFDYPWGLRLDGHAVWAIRNFGWMELGFKKNYIENLLSSNGFTTEWSTVDGIGPYGDFFIASRE